MSTPFGPPSVIWKRDAITLPKIAAVEDTFEKREGQAHNVNEMRTFLEGIGPEAARLVWCELHRYT